MAYLEILVYHLVETSAVIWCETEVVWIWRADLSAIWCELEVLWIFERVMQVPCSGKCCHLGSIRPGTTSFKHSLRTCILQQFPTRGQQSSSHYMALGLKDNERSITSTSHQKAALVSHQMTALTSSTCINLSIVHSTATSDHQLLPGGSMFAESAATWRNGGSFSSPKN